MFLVSNLEMMKAGLRSGVMAVFPSLNFRHPGELETILETLEEYAKSYRGNYGVNIIVQRSNPLSAKHTKICLEKRVPFFITSLGNPREVIRGAHPYGGKVFCDVTNLAHAEKCADEGCDGFIAVGQGAGGHAGPNPLQVLVPALKERFPQLPVVAAGGITNGAGLLSVQVLGASGVSVGTRFIASTEASVNEQYKKAVLASGLEDIVMTTKLSGSPCSIINNEAARKMGYTQNWFEKWLSNNPQTKKWFKTLIQLRGMKKLEQSILPNNYLKLWTAGKSSALIHDILPCEEIIARIKTEYQQKVQEVKDWL
jgi:nitronate monooxygenase